METDVMEASWSAPLMDDAGYFHGSSGLAPTAKGSLNAFAQPSENPGNDLLSTEVM
jgi:hypothetical protein